MWLAVRCRQRYCNVAKHFSQAGDDNNECFVCVCASECVFLFIHFRDLHRKLLYKHEKILFCSCCCCCCYCSRWWQCFSFSRFHFVCRFVAVRLLYISLVRIRSFSILRDSLCSRFAIYLSWSYHEWTCCVSFIIFISMFWCVCRFFSISFCFMPLEYFMLCKRHTSYEFRIFTKLLHQHWIISLLINWFYYAVAPWPFILLCRPTGLQSATTRILRIWPMS